MGIVVLGFVLHIAGVAGADTAVRFNADIRSIFVSNCFMCHGPDGVPRKAGLRLDDDSTLFTPLPTGATAVVPGDRTRSALFQRIASADPSHVMPPADSGKSLSAAEIETIGRWIDQGAAWEEHWAFQPLTPVALPDRADGWARNAIDQFIGAALDAQGLTPSPEADRRTLIRRLTFDLHGLPPTPEEVTEFVNDTSPDAYAKLVDRLLASPRYGERWARHWLDVVHYGDTHGYDKDQRRPNAWPYRDYVIGALNDDLPYGQFIREQLAADVLAPEKPEAIAALGFIAAGPWDLVGHVELREDTMDKKITRMLDRDDMVMNAMNTFVSATVQCARCHDHKFDPISQAEYYGLQAVFAGVDRADRPMETDRRAASMRAKYTRRKEELEARFKDVNAKYMAATSPELEAMEASLAELVARRDGLNASPTNGYHSGIESTPDVTKWVQVDLGARHPIHAVVLYPAFPTDYPVTPSFGFPVRFRVEVSDDPAFATSTVIAKETAADYPNAHNTPYAIYGLGLEARYVRVTATRLWYRNGDYTIALAELRVMSGDTNVALGAAVDALDSTESGRWSKAALVDGYTSREPIREDGVHAGEVEQLESQIAALKTQCEQERGKLAGGEVMSVLLPLRRQLELVNATLAALPKPTMVYAAASEFSPSGEFRPPKGVRAVHVLRRGDVNQEGEAATPGALSLVRALDATFEAEDEAARRASLAEWVADPRNPLTWRSIVNRVWHYHFGQGIVETPSDFGHMGAMPTHPELLDWLVQAFLEHGQSLKWLHTLIVTSATYRQVSDNNEMGARVDASNRYLWRMHRSQLDAESLRDAVLAISGKLDLTMGGPGVDWFVYKDDHSPGYFYDRFDVTNAAAFRRSIYRFVVRSVPDPFMTCLDSADPSQNVPVRNSTITALQALAVMNNPFMVQQAAYTAERIAAEADALEDQIARAYWLMLGRAPAEHETAALAAYAAEHGLANMLRVMFNMNEFMFVD